MKSTSVMIGLGIGLLIVSCTSNTDNTRFLLDHPDKTVGMEVTYRKGSLEYSHPYHLRADQLERVLESIEVQPSSLLARMTGSSAKSQKAFSPEQREFLANQLSVALQHASPLETVTFYLATPRGNGIWEITSGGLYLQESDLHLSLPNFRQTVPAKSPPQKARNHPLLSLGEPLHSLIALPPGRHLPQDVVTELWYPQNPHFVFPLEKFAKRSLMGDNPLTEPSSPLLHSRESIKQRLLTLEELRREGLLSEKEYQQNRQKILEELEENYREE